MKTIWRYMKLRLGRIGLSVSVKLLASVLELPASVILLKRAAASLLPCLLPSPAAPPIGMDPGHPTLSPDTVLLG